jgi:hypothetical protein
MAVLGTVADSQSPQACAPVWVLPPTAERLADSGQPTWPTLKLARCSVAFSQLASWHPRRPQKWQDRGVGEWVFSCILHGMTSSRP